MGNAGGKRAGLLLWGSRRGGMSVRVVSSSEALSLNPDGSPRRTVLGLSPLYKKQDAEARRGKNLAQDLTAKSWQAPDLGMLPPSAC